MKFNTQFKKAESNFKIAIMADMWLTGFDVHFISIKDEQKSIHP